MTTKEKILNTIAINEPSLVSLPVIERDIVIEYEDCYLQFKAVLESIGGKVELIKDISIIKEKISYDKISGALIIDTLSTTANVDEQRGALTVFELERLVKVYVKGSIGVAENGAVWIYESQMQNRLLPFICQHLVLVINSSC